MVAVVALFRFVAAAQLLHQLSVCFCFECLVDNSYRLTHFLKIDLVLFPFFLNHWILQHLVDVFIGESMNVFVLYRKWRLF